MANFLRAKRRNSLGDEHDAENLRRQLLADQTREKLREELKTHPLNQPITKSNGRLRRT